MNVGYMRNNLKPTELAKLISIFSKSYGINLIYLRPDDVDLETDMVDGKIFINNEWIPITTSLPEFIDISQFCFKRKNKNIINYLRNNTMLSDNGLNRRNKLKFIQEVSKDNTINHLIIPTKKILKIEDVLTAVEEYNQVILKPISGQFGVGIYSISETDSDQYLVEYESVKKHISKEELKDFIENDILTNKYIVQKYINSKTKVGYPFDCRINMEKNINGEWVVARKFIRIGIGQNVVSNISQGGAVSDFKAFIKSNFDLKTTQKIQKKFKEIEKKIPKKVESLRKQELMTLGIDIGIDTDGELYLFEVNGAPGTSQLKAQAAELRAQYYSYIKNKKI